MKNTKHESKQRRDKTQNEPQRMGRAQPSAASQHMAFKATHNKDESLPQFMKSPQFIFSHN